VLIYRNYAKYFSPYLVLPHPQSHLGFQDYGVKANLKSEALIDLLLDTQSVLFALPIHLAHNYV
jgi:hypothetical protein